MGPLAGIRVIELAAQGPTPFCGMLLADMGADVLRVDRVGQHAAVSGLPPDLELRGRNKRSAAIDLKHPDGLRTLRDLLGHADVLIEGYRPGVTERLGIGPEICAALNPRLIYARATGWGQDGPFAKRAGHDINYLSLTGALDLIGPRDGPPVPPLNLLGDYAGGALYLAFGIAAALLEVRTSGKGQVIDAAMMDGVTHLLTIMHAFRQAGQLAPGRGNNQLDGGAPFYGIYGTQDGQYVAVGALEERFYGELLVGLELNPADLPDRMERENWPALREVFAGRFRSRTRVAWEQVFASSDACVTPVLALEEAVSHPQTGARGLVQHFAGRDHSAPAPRLSRTPGALRLPPAIPGQHTSEALIAWGIKPDAVAQGLEKGFLGAG